MQIDISRLSTCLPFEFEARVHIDGDKSIVAVVTAFMISVDGLQVRVEWFANGDAKSAWIGERRLSRVEV
jgi:hypothetical protein